MTLSKGVERLARVRQVEVEGIRLRLVTETPPLARQVFQRLRVRFPDRGRTSTPGVRTPSPFEVGSKADGHDVPPSGFAARNSTRK